jgi:hypothetical protein
MPGCHARHLHAAWSTNSACFCAEPHRNVTTWPLRHIMEAGSPGLRPPAVAAAPLTCACAPMTWRHAATAHRGAALLRCICLAPGTLALGCRAAAQTHSTAPKHRHGLGPTAPRAGTMIAPSQSTRQYRSGIRTPATPQSMATCIPHDHVSDGPPCDHARTAGQRRQ